MHSETDLSPFDTGMLSPVTAGLDALVSDFAVLDALVAAEVALLRARADLGAVRAEELGPVEASLGWRGPGLGCRGHGLAPAALALAAVEGGNPVIPLVRALRQRFGADTPLHRGATSQDILDTALMLVAASAVQRILSDITDAADTLARRVSEHADDIAVARTLTQHAVPTTIGLRLSTWLRGLRRARGRLAVVGASLPAQLGGAGGTLASFVELDGALAAERLPARFAAELGLAAPDAPWHTTRWPVTELGDALVQAIDAIGVIAAEVATLSRTEIAEAAEGSPGGSSAMPQKRNPTVSVLLRSAAVRAPHLGATLHTAAAFAVDERPDGAWHAEWPALRELLRLALGASSHVAALVAGVRFDAGRARVNLEAGGGLATAERVDLALRTRFGAEPVGAAIRSVERGLPFAGALAAALGPELDAETIAELTSEAGYLGLAGSLASRAVDEGTHS